jgi:hypothetical protein
MAYIRNSSTNKIKGRQAEIAFAKQFKYCIIRESTEQEDIKQHWDYLIRCNNGVERKVDVKTGNIRDSILRCEVTNRMGRKGWVKGLADYIAYEQEDYWLFVKREELEALIKKNYRKNNLGYWNDPYKGWHQHGSKAIMTFVPLSDVTTAVQVKK